MELTVGELAWCPLWTFAEHFQDLLLLPGLWKKNSQYVSIDYSRGTNGINHILQADTSKSSLSSEFRWGEKHQRKEIKTRL